MRSHTVLISSKPEARNAPNTVCVSHIHTILQVHNILLKLIKRRIYFKNQHRDQGFIFNFKKLDFCFRSFSPPSLSVLRLLHYFIDLNFHVLT